MINDLDKLPKAHVCCWHHYSGVIHMVLLPGHTLMQCCECQGIRQVHMAHMSGHKPKRPEHYDRPIHSVRL